MDKAPVIYGRTVTAYRRWYDAVGKWLVLCQCGQKHWVGEEVGKIHCECGLRLIVRDK